LGLFESVSWQNSIGTTDRKFIGTLNLLIEGDDKINSKCVVFKEWKYGTNLYIYFVDE
jgi:hypothetical protein